MTALRDVVVAAFDGPRLWMVAASVVDGTATVRHGMVLSVPADLDLRDAEAVGRWLRQELARTGAGRAPLVFVVPRHEVVLKRLRLPMPPGGEPELAAMVRLQMTRQLALPVEHAAIDYVIVGEQPVGRPDGQPAGPGNAGAERGRDAGRGAATRVSVLAAVLAGERVQWYGQVARVAGCRLLHIALRSAGLARVLAESQATGHGTVLGVGLGWASSEFVVVQDGSLVFARSVDVGLGTPTGAEVEAVVVRLATEAKRTWMSYRVGEESGVVDAVVVVGDEELTGEIGRRCGEALEMPVVRGDDLSRWPQLPPGLSPAERLVFIPLLGVLVEVARRRPGLDFAHPRRPPDTRASRRQRILIGLLVLILLAGGVWIVASGDLARLDRELQRLGAEGETLAAEYRIYQRDHARLKHLDAWLQARVDWIAHLRFLSDQMPDPREAQLDQVSGRLHSQIELVASGGRYDPEGWRARQWATFALAGRTRDMSVASGVRGRLLASRVFDRVENTGPDAPGTFELEVTTALASPQDTTPADSDRGAAALPEAPAPARPGGTRDRPGNQP